VKRISPMCKCLVWRPVARMMAPMNNLFATILFVAVTFAALTPVQAERRVALVIGNSAYQHTASLANPKNDAEAVAGVLTRLGFEVVSGLDVDIQGLIGLVRKFSKTLEGADVALFYYAGHGLQLDGNNYLVPVDAQLDDRADLDFGTIKLEAVLRQMTRNRSANLVFLDACRDNPLTKTLARSMASGRSANFGRGLARVEAGVGTLIAYATQPGNIALDGTGRHSPFTRALLSHIETPGLDVSTMMIKVRQDVIRATGEKQIPWDHSSLTGQFYFKPGAQAATQQLAANTPTDSPDTTARSANNGNTFAAQTRLTAEQNAMELSFWETVKDSNDKDLLQTYIDRFPYGVYVDLARVLIARAEQRLEPKKVEVARAEPQNDPAQSNTQNVAPQQNQQQTAALTDNTSEPQTQNQGLDIGKLLRKANNGDRRAAIKLAEHYDREGDPELAGDYALIALRDGGKRYAGRFINDTRAWSKDFWRVLQAGLNADGAYRGAIDGLPGSGTKRAVRIYAGMRVAAEPKPKPRRRTAPPPSSPPKRGKPPPNKWCLIEPNSARCTNQ